ncbi:hypothetical protein AKO1_008716 [Acrasis kona]|uniref:Uncharacterized protein n=1 Tax=Acrasis kona TaxID=1008807 RepID=A0AAW2ZDE7_9EUKA
MRLMCLVLIVVILCLHVGISDGKKAKGGGAVSVLNGTISNSTIGEECEWRCITGLVGGSLTIVCFFIFVIVSIAITPKPAAIDPSAYGH